MRTLEQTIRRFQELKEEYVDYDDQIYDLIYYQVDGMYDGYDEYENDEPMIKRLNELADNLQKHLDYIKTAPEFDWVFG